MWRICNAPACTGKVTWASCCLWSDFQCYSPSPQPVHSAGPEPQSWSPCPVPQTALDWWNLPTIKHLTAAEYSTKQFWQNCIPLLSDYCMKRWHAVDQTEFSLTGQHEQVIYRMWFLSFNWLHHQVITSFNWPSDCTWQHPLGCPRNK